MNVVFKYSLAQCDVQTVTLPVGSEILSVQDQQGSWQLWALVDPQASVFEPRKIRIAGTGHLIHENIKKHISTFQMHDGALVFHAFELWE